MPAPARVIREPVRNQLGIPVIRMTVPNPRLRGRSACGAFFRLPPSRSPNRAGRPTWLVRHAPRLGLRPSPFALRPSPFALPRLGCRAPRPSRCDAAAPSRAVGADKCASGDDLTMPAPARVIRKPVRNQLGIPVIRMAVPNPRLRGRSACGAFFRLPPSRSPNRAGRPTWLVRHAPRVGLRPSPFALRPSPCRALAAESIARLGATRAPHHGLSARKNAPPVNALMMPAPARVMREPVRNQLGGRVILASGPNGRLSGRSACGAFFRLTPSRSPNRAGRPTGLVRRAPRVSPTRRALGIGRWALGVDLNGPALGLLGRHQDGDGAGAGRPGTLERGDAPRSRNAGGAIRAASPFPVIRVAPQHHRRIGALGRWRPDHPYSPRPRAPRASERRPRSRFAEAGPRTGSAGTGPRHAGRSV